MHKQPSRISRIPFDPARLPFFYGWPVLIAGTLGLVMSSPGQTVGVSVFTDFLIEDLSVSRSSLSIAYLVGTVASAISLGAAGKLYDRFGGRIVASAAAASLALVLVYLSFVPTISLSIQRVFGTTTPVFGFVLVTLGFWGLRFSGQGMLTLASRNMVMEWYDRRRGLANAVMGISLSFGFSIAPRVFEAVIGPNGAWQSAWRTIAIAAAGFGVFALLVYRDRPEDHGMVPDGPLAGVGGATHAETARGHEFTLPEARRTYSFWIFASTLLLAGLLLTSYTFHIVSIFGDAGMDRGRAVSIFLPAAIVAVVVEFTGSWLSDYIKLKYLAIVQLVGSVVLSVSLVLLSTSSVWVIGMIIGHGLMQGMFGILSNVTWPRFFGRRHLGAIAGFATAITVVGTALGPAFFSGLRDVFGTYAPAAIVTAVIGVVLILLATRADRPADTFVPGED